MALVNFSTGEMFYFLNDRLGTPQMLTDASNTVVWEGLYKAFGEADVNPNSSVVNNFRFPGQYYDAETGLHYNYHRYYVPSTGRYLRPDPIGPFGGINLFEYSLNNPINSVDPLGLAEYLVSWGTVSGSRKRMGAVHVYGAVIALDRNKNNFHNAVSFSGKFASVSLGSPAGSIFTKSQRFKDSYAQSDVARVKGLSSFTSITSSLFGKGGISLGLYNFGKLYSASGVFSGVEGYDFSLTSVQGAVELNSAICEVTPEFVRELLGLEDPDLDCSK